MSVVEYVEVSDHRGNRAMSRDIPDDKKLLNEYTSVWLPKGKPKGEYQETTVELVELAKKNERGFEALMKDLRKKWVFDAIERDIEKTIIERELLRATSKWDDEQKMDKKLRSLYDEMEEAAKTYA